MRKDRSSSSRDETNEALPKDDTSVGAQVEMTHEEASNRAAKATKERRYILKLSPSEATNPGPPDDYRTTPGFWYYGWPLSKEDVERILSQLCGHAVDMKGTPIDFLVGNLLFLLDKRLHYESHVVYVKSEESQAKLDGSKANSGGSLVKSDGSPARFNSSQANFSGSRPLPEPFLPYAPGPCFLVLFSPVIRLFDQRPTREQLDTLVRDYFQGEEPRWCEDARKRED